MANTNKQKHTRRVNFLNRVQAVQDKYQENHVEGLPTTVIWKKYIYPQFSISLQTLREYLAINVQREVKNLD